MLCYKYQTEMPAFEITDQLLASLPDPIAIPARRYRDENDSRSKLLLLVDTIETVFKFGSAIAIKELMRIEIEAPSESLVSLRSSIRCGIDRPSLGQHVGFIRDICAELGKSGNIPKVISSIKLLQDAVLADPLLKLRNDYKGHGAVTTKDLADRLMGGDLGEKFGILLKIVAQIHQEFPVVMLSLGADLEPPHFALRQQDGSIYLDLFPLFLGSISAEPLSVIYNGRKSNGSKSGIRISYLNYQTGEGSTYKPGEVPADAFNAEFPPAPKKASEFSHIDAPANELIEARSNSFKGRDADLELIHQFMAESSLKVLVVTGAPGQGKTSLLCKWLNTVATDGNDKQLVIRHFIVEGDAATCTTVGIFRSLCTQLGRALEHRGQQKPDWKIAEWQQEFCTLLHQAGQKFHSVAIVIDGLDEAERHRQSNLDEESILQWLPAPSLLAANVRWMLSIRPQYLQDPAFRAKYGVDKARQHEMGKLDANAIRAILYDYASNWREVALREDLVEIILEKSEGSPIYIHQLAGDLEKARLDFSEAGIATIPQGMVEFHRRILEEIEHRIAHKPSNLDHVRMEALKGEWAEQLEAGEVSQEKYRDKVAAAEAKIQKDRTSPAAEVLGLLAVCLEPLPVSLMALLTGASLTSLQNTLEEARSVLSGSFPHTDSVDTRYSLYHSSFREFLLQHRPEAAQWGKDRFKQFCSQPNHRTDEYVIRNGVAHLLEFVRTKPTEEAVRDLSDLLTDLDFITVKIRAGMVPELLHDYEQALTRLTGSPSSMFHGLEMDDEDRSWIAEARAACIAGNTSPYPARGGASIIAKLKEDYSAFLVKMRLEADIKRQQRLESGLAEESDDDLDDFGLDFLKLPNGETNFSELEFDSEPAEQTEDEIIALSRQCYEENNQGVHDNEKRRFEIAEQIFKSGTITDKAIQKILNGCVNNYSDDRAARIRDFADLVAGSWRQLADTSVDTAAYCSNYRQEGPVHTAGTESMTARSVPWIEQLYRPKGGVRRLRLNFTESDQQGKIGFFKDFSMALRARYKDISGIRQYHFDILDTTRNRQLATYSGEAPAPRGGSSFPSHSDWPKITDGGSHVYFQDELWELDLKEKVAMRVPSGEELLIRAALMAAPPFRRRSEPTTDYREPVFSEDGYLAADADYYYLHLLETQLGGPVDTNHVPSLSSRFTNDINGKPGSFFFSAESRLIIGRNYKSVPVMDLISGEMIFLQNTDAQQVATTRDGRLLAAQFLGTVRVWDLRTGLELRQFPTHVFESDNLQFSESGELLNVHSEIVDLRTGSRHLRFDENGGGSEFLEKSNRYTITPTHAIDHLRSHKLKGNTGQLSLDQKEEISSIILINEKIVISLKNGLVTLPFCLGGIARHFSGFEDLWLLRPAHESPGNYSQSYPSTIASNASTITGKILLAVDDGTLGLMDPQTDTIKRLTDFEYLSNMDHEVGNSIMAIPLESQQDRDERVKREQSVNADHFPQPEPEKSTPKFSIDDAEMTQDGKWILTVTSWDSVRVWRTVDGSCVRAIPLPKAADYYSGRATKIQLSRDGKHCHVAFSSGAIYRLIDWEKPETVWSLIYEFPREKNVECTSVQNRRYLHMQSYSDNGWVRFSQDGQTHILCDLENGENLPLFFDGRDFNTGELLAVTDDSQHLIVSSGNEQKDHFIRVLRLKDSSEVLRFPLTSEFQAMSNIAPDGRFVVLTKAWDLLRLKLHLPGS